MKKYNDDDGRTIANMDNLDRRGVLGGWFGILSPSVRREVLGEPGRFNDTANMGGEIELTREERWALIKYTMKYSLGLGLIFLIAFGLLIFILFKLW